MPQVLWSLLAPKFIVVYLFVASALYVHLRGRVRHSFVRQLKDHSTLMAPYNTLMYLFSAVPPRPLIEVHAVPELAKLRENWQVIRDEALGLLSQGGIRAATGHNDLGFNSFFKEGWKRFYLTWYGHALPSAQVLCPKTVALLESLPHVNGAMFALLPPGGKLNRHRDPFAGSLRYHLGLVTPNSDDCRIFIDGEPYSWRDGEDVLFDETYIHSAENKTGVTRIILFCDVERPLRTRAMTALNRWVSRNVIRASASQNVEDEKIGAANRIYALLGRGSDLLGRLKRRNRTAFRTVKYALIAGIVYWIFVQPLIAGAAAPGARAAPAYFDVSKGAHPHDVAAAPGAGSPVYYTAQMSGKLGILDPKSGKLEEVSLGPRSAPHGVVIGPDAAPWLTDGGQNAIVRVDPKTHAVKTWPLPADAAGANLNTLTFDKKGRVWFTGQSGYYGRLDPATGAMQVWSAPRGTGPYGITTTPSGDVYYASLAGSYIGRIDVESGAATVIEPPTKGQGARRVWSDSRGRIWVSYWNTGQIGMYDPASTSWREWRLPGNAHAYAVWVDDRDKVWLSDWSTNAIVRFDPATEKFESFESNRRGADVRQMAGRAGELWAAESGTDRLVSIPTG